MLVNTLPLLAMLPAALGQLNTLAKAKGLKYFGTATDNGELTDTQYTAILNDTTQFGQITPGNTQKWQYVEPQNGTFAFTQGDVITSWAEENDQLLRCHNLVWYSQLPSWVTSGTWTNETLIAALKLHIQTEVTHYKGQCYCWDVVNEALNSDGTFMTDVFYNTIGEEYIAIAFETAALYDPDVKLYYNDYNLEYSGAKTNAALGIVSMLKSRGIKIDGVGFESHFIVGTVPNAASLESIFKQYTALGVEIAITELDIRFSSLPPTDAGLVQQGTDYASVVGACVGTTNCVGVTIWDFTDKYSWIPSTFSGQGDACLWYANFTLHPAYYSVVSVLGGAVSTTSATTVTSTSVPVTTTASGSTLTTSTSVATTAATSTAPGGDLPEWSQCAGLSWTGSGTCAAGFTCTYFNPYYSQCL